MEPTFQTSFIPKKPMIEKRMIASQSLGLFGVLGLLLFFAMIITSAGLFFYKGLVGKNISDMETNLKQAKDRFEPAKIVQLQNLDRRLIASNEVLAKHVAISPIFKILSDITMKTVQYTDFTYELVQDQGIKIKVGMQGIAVGYRAVALQSDLYNANKNLIDPVFSDLTLDQKGNVTFRLEFLVDPNLVNYKEMLELQSSSPVSEIPTDTSTIPADPDTTSTTPSATINPPNSAPPN